MRLTITDSRRLAAFLCAALFFSFAEAGAAQRVSGAEEPTPAYHLAEGSLVRSRIVALGRDMIVEGEAQSHAVVVSGSLHLSGSVGGDVVILEGDAHLAETARIAGDLYVLGGVVELASGAVVGGRSVAYPDTASVWLGLLESPTLGTSHFAPQVLGAKLALLAFWSFVALLLFGVARREMLVTSESLRVEPFHNFFVGLTGILAMTLTALFFAAFAGPFLGVPLLMLVAVVALLLRFWGMVAIFHAAGVWIERLLGRKNSAELTAATLGLIALGVCKMIPWVGVVTWLMASFLGVGAALSTKLGRREAWFAE